jgi:hypothetical protein
MAINPVNGPIVDKATSDPNGTPGQTSGGVPATQSRTRESGLPTAGGLAGIPPFLDSPTLDPLAETFAPPVGPQQ